MAWSVLFTLHDLVSDSEMVCCTIKSNWRIVGFIREGDSLPSPPPEICHNLPQQLYIIGSVIIDLNLSINYSTCTMPSHASTLPGMSCCSRLIISGVTIATNLSYELPYIATSADSHRYVVIWYCLLCSVFKLNWEMVMILYGSFMCSTCSKNVVVTPS